MARPSMATMITRVRTSIGDMAGVNQHFTDNDVQNVLDEHRFTVRLAALRPSATILSGGIYTFLDYYADTQNWEDDYTLQWSNYAALTSTLAEPIAGHWQFTNTQPGGQYPPVMITGKYYDIHAAIADLLESWASSMSATMWSFTSDGQTFSRQQAVTNLLATAQRERSKCLITSAMIERTDIGTSESMITLEAGGAYGVDMEN